MVSVKSIKAGGTDSKPNQRASIWDGNNARSKARAVRTLELAYTQICSKAAYVGGC